MRYHLFYKTRIFYDEEYKSYVRQLEVKNEYIIEVVVSDESLIAKGLVLFTCLLYFFS
jgi:hypothetical protein